jgi:alginate O-acetyltransferase complex protein AlgF
MKHTLLAAIAISATIVGPSFADDNGLYEDVFAPNSSFVRVLAPGQSLVSINGTTINDIQDGVSAYINVMPGDVTVSLSNGATTLNAQASTHYTVVVTGGEFTGTLVDAISNSPAKSDVSFYNLTDVTTAELYVPLAKAVAIADVNALEGKSVALKAPLTLDFELRTAEGILATVPQVALKRRSGVSIVLTGSDGSYSAIAATNGYLK